MKGDITIANKKYLDCTPAITIDYFDGELLIEESMDFELAEILYDGQILRVCWVRKEEGSDFQERGTKYFNMRHVVTIDVRTLPEAQTGDY